MGLAIYKLNVGVYFSTEQSLKELVNRLDAVTRPRKWIQVMDEVTKDPWGRGC